jgi:hypothetical protein
MRKFWMVLAAIPLAAAVANAQSEVPLTPKAEAMASYSYAHLGTANGFHAANLNWGWDAAVVGNLNHWSGLMFDVDGHYGKQPILNSGGLNAGTNVHSFLFGPRFTVRKTDRYTPFFHTLAGVARVHRDLKSIVGANHAVSEPTASGTAAGLFNGFNDTIWPFAMKVGGGVDVKMNDNVAVRPFQMDYLLTRRGGSNINNFTVSAGIVFRSSSKL